MQLNGCFVLEYNWIKIASTIIVCKKVGGKICNWRQGHILTHQCTGAPESLTL